MPLSRLVAMLSADPVVDAIGCGEESAVAVPEAARAVVLAAALRAGARHPMLVGVPTAGEAERLVAALEVYMGDPARTALFPAWETLPFERVSPSAATMGQRLRVMGWLNGSAPPEGGPPPDIVVASVRAMTQRICPPGSSTQPIVIRYGATVGSEAPQGDGAGRYAYNGPDGGIDPEGLVERLVAIGYRREYQVEHRGEVARRGSIVDVFPPVGHPVRADFFGDEVDRLQILDVNDQRSGEHLPSVVLHPCRELIPGPEIQIIAERLMVTEPWGAERWEKLAAGMVFDGMESWLPWLRAEGTLLADLIGAEGSIVIVEPGRMRARAGELVEEEAALGTAIAGTWGLPEGREVPRLHLGFDRMASGSSAPVTLMSSVPEGSSMPSIEARGWGDLVPGDVVAIAERLGSLLREGYTVVLCAHGVPSSERMAAQLREHGVLAEISDRDVPGAGIRGAPRGAVQIVVEEIGAGFMIPSAGLAVLSEDDLTGRHRVHRRPMELGARRGKVAHRAGIFADGAPVPGVTEGFFTDLAPGDYVVHRHHGVGRYVGMVRRSLGGAERDYLQIDYRGDDKLYVPSDQLDQLTRYSGGETPTLHRLGGADFERSREKVRRAVAEVAQELIVLYSKRMVTPGHTHAADTPWQQEVEDAFPYEETPDQLVAIEAVKRDMESPHPMDRIICGDVGFGKTEVALRAAFKAVQDGKQVAVLVPTTLLAQQHYETFSGRLAGYPVRVEMLSRFLSAAQVSEVVGGLADGSVDIVIGTHRLLSPDIKIRDLGLLVVDEEQRFGVTHKEAIKAISTGVDVLTLAATPIPRTLEMGLTGIRDITVLQTPPAGRQPILTYVGEYDERAVVEAIRRELLREGQVFFVHNRVRDIHEVSRRLSELVPEARIVVAHGQMDEASLEKAAVDFADGRYDVLCCTTIIESGIDMPTVNTLVVDRADLLGLGQLHQLRGRVGRAGQRAYAYLFYPSDVKMTEESFERLRTVGEMTELGSGLKIAMRDLEIRGAGNLLGKDQSGHIAAVGYDLYVAMVGEALAELKGEEVRRPAEVTIEVAVDAYLPDGYISRDDARVEAYRRLATAESTEEVDAIGAEWQDRYGPPPPSAIALLAVGRLRAECILRSVTEVTVSPGRPGGPFGGRAVARLSPVTLKASASVRLTRLHAGSVYKEPGTPGAGGAPSPVGSLVVPVPRDVSDYPGFLSKLLADLMPAEPAHLAASVPVE